MTEPFKPISVVCARPAGAQATGVLPKAVKRRINRLAHDKAAKYEQEIRAATTAQFQCLSVQGMALPKLLAELEKLEQSEISCPFEPTLDGVAASR